MGVLRTTKRLFISLIGGTYVESIRNVPPLVLVFIFYFFISDQIMPLLGIEDFVRSRSFPVQKVLAFFFASPQLFTAFGSGVITVAIFQGAYITEIVRSGIQSIDKGPMGSVLRPRIVLVAANALRDFAPGHQAGLTAPGQ